MLLQNVGPPYSKLIENVITDLYLIKLLDPTFVSYDELVNGGLGRDEKEGRGQIVQGGNHSVSASG